MAMAGEGASCPSSDAVILGEAYSTARELLLRAEEDAAQIRVAADRYVRQREQEAGLLIAKARRLLAVAEERAAAIDATPRPADPRAAIASALAAIDEAASDLHALAAVDLDVAAVDLYAEVPPAPGSLHSRNDLDRILAAAINKAVDRSFAADG